MRRDQLHIGDIVFHKSEPRGEGTIKDVGDWRPKIAWTRYVEGYEETVIYSNYLSHLVKKEPDVPTGYKRVDPGWWVGEDLDIDDLMNPRQPFPPLMERVWIRFGAYTWPSDLGRALYHRHSNEEPWLPGVARLWEDTFHKRQEEEGTVLFRYPKDLWQGERNVYKSLVGSLEEGQLDVLQEYINIRRANDGHPLRPKSF